MPIRLWRASIGLLLGLFVTTLVLGSAMAADCEFVLGFKDLRDVVGHGIVGECLENEHFSDNGDSEQKTTGGLLVWRKADNFTAFTDGHSTWINGPNGLEKRLNTERFSWEPSIEGESLPLPPAPSVTFSTYSVDTDGYTTEVVVSIDNPAPHGSTLWWTPTSFDFLQADGNTEYHNTFICRAEDAGQVYEYRVVSRGEGDGVVYRDTLGPETDVSFSHTCTTPTGLPSPPVPWVSIIPSRIEANYYASSNREVLSIDANVLWPESVTKIEYVFEGGGGSFTSTEGSSFTKNVAVCLPSEGGTQRSFRLVARAYGDGVTYRADYGPWSSSATLIVNCPVNLPETPAPTLIPSSLPAAPAPGSTISARRIEANYQAWSSNLGVMLVEASVLWPESVARIRYIFTVDGVGEWSRIDRGGCDYP